MNFSSNKLYKFIRRFISETIRRKSEKSIDNKKRF